MILFNQIAQKVRLKDELHSNKDQNIIFQTETFTIYNVNVSTLINSPDFNVLMKDIFKQSGHSFDKYLESIKSECNANIAKEKNKKAVTQQSNSNLICEEVTELHVTCSGNHYVRDLKNSDNLKRDVKKIEDYFDKNTASPAKSAVAK